MHIIQEKLSEKKIYVEISVSRIQCISEPVKKRHLYILFLELTESKRCPLKVITMTKKQ